ncbi:MAG: hypothetical protein HYZ57_20270 [Acidobacteria bacterium]|nr:hypothetical protein [Acidobacteriota bacterium]
MPTKANPYIDPAEIEAAREDLTEAVINQEYLALFVNWEGAVFRKVIESATATRKSPVPEHKYVIGVDGGRTIDYTVVAVVDETERGMVEMHRSNRLDYTVQRERLGVLVEQYQPQTVVCEQNSIGQPTSRS